MSRLIPTIVCLALTLAAMSPPALATPLVITPVHIVDVEQARILKDRQVVVEGGVIQAVHALDWQPNEAVERIEGHHGYLMAGMNEMHAHVPGERSAAQYLDDTLLLYLANGITRIRGMLGEPLHLRLRQQLLAGERLGPLLVTSGPSLNGNSVTNPQQAREKVAAQARAGYDFLKIHPGIDRESFDALVEEAKAQQIPMAGHVPADVGLQRALRVGMATIDHLDGYAQWLAEQSEAERLDEEGFFAYRLAPGISEAAIQQAVEITREAGVAQVPTDSLMLNALLVDPDIGVDERPEFRFVPSTLVERWRDSARDFQNAPGHRQQQAQRYMRVRHQLISGMHDAGVPILLGSDAPQIFNVPGFSIHHEIELMSEAGLDNAAILRAATTAPAAFFGMADSSGRVKAGFEANLVLLDGNPLEDLANLKNPLGVMVAGRWHSRETLQKALAQLAKRHDSEASSSEQ